MKRTLTIFGLLISVLCAPSLYAGDLVVEGWIGAGTTSPKHRLHVVGAAQITHTDPNYDVWIQGGDQNWDADFSIREKRNLAILGQASTDRLYINFGGEYTGGTILGGNVGIGTNTPTAKLDVSGNANISGTLDVSDSINSDGFYFFQNLGMLWYNVGQEMFLFQDTQGISRPIRTNGIALGSSAVPPDGGALINGTVGIGTSNPTAKAHINFSGAGTTEQVGLKVNVSSTNADTVLLLSSDDGTIGGGSDFIRAEDGGNGVFVVEGDGDVNVSGTITASNVCIGADCRTAMPNVYKRTKTDYCGGTAFLCSHGGTLHSNLAWKLIGYAPNAVYQWCALDQDGLCSTFTPSCDDWVLCMQ